MAMIYVLYVLKLKLWLRSNPVSKSFYYAIRPLSSERNPLPAKNQTLRSYRVYISPTK